MGGGVSVANAITWLVTVGLLSLHPDCCFTRDRRNMDGHRYVELCAGLYQRPETWACVEVPR